MATGALTSLGIGSGLDLQDILDKLKNVDEAKIRAKENKKEDLQTQLDAYNKVNAKLFSIKSDALNLSLESNYLDNSVSVTDEDVISAIVGDGYDESSHSIDVIQKARRNSWESTGVDSRTAPMFAEPASGIAEPERTEAISQDETLTIFYGAAGDQQQIDITLDAEMTLSEITEEINTSVNNTDGGTQLVSASFVLGGDGDYYIRLSAASEEASAESEISVAGFDWIAADTTVAITQDESTLFLAVPPGTSYAGMANLINSAENNPGVTAAMIDNGDSNNPYQLTLTSDATGEDARITLTNLDGLTEVTGAAAASLNAEFTVNGISYSRQSNKAIKDVITGVTFDLKNTGESTLNIEASRETVKQDVLSMIEGFNDLISYIRGSQTGSESTDTESANAEENTDNPLDGSSSANRIVYQLQSLLTTVLDLDTDYKSLTNLGLEIDRSGTISIDEAKLDKAIATDPDALKALFLGDAEKGITGLADVLNDALGDMVSSTGITKTEINEAETKIARIDKDIETETERLDRRYEIMANEFARLDSYINQINAEANALTSMINAFNNTGEK